MCPSGWTKRGDGCYMRLDALRTWHDSLAECRKLGGSKASLISVHSVQEKNFLTDFLNEEGAWIGLNDVKNEGFYAWADGSLFVYVNWNSAEAEKSPSVKQAHDCVAATSSHWKSRNCNEKRPSVCVVSTALGKDIGKSVLGCSAYTPCFI